ncbi:hypothetical protein MP228_008145 [Amoeboaphelidium protococcarum]|nr:hypothetical protein MP228_008145 [Amoeboaphelidium protococcarum]
MLCNVESNASRPLWVSIQVADRQKSIQDYLHLVGFLALPVPDHIRSMAQKSKRRNLNHYIQNKSHIY